MASGLILRMSRAALFPEKATKEALSGQSTQELIRELDQCLVMLGCLQAY